MAKKAKKEAKDAVKRTQYYKYALKVHENKIVACELVKKACDRFILDIETQEARRLEFKLEAAKDAIDFCQLLKHSKGEWAGTTFNLEAWQQFIVANLFGWYKKGGPRRFRTAYISIARKNGKSTLLAALGLYLFFHDGEPGAEVYSAATKLEQAKIMHSEAIRMVNSTPALKKRIKVFRDNLNIPGTASKFEPLGSDANTLDGLNIHAALIDELHAHKTRDLWDVIETATGSRRQPMQIAITTAGYDRHSVCYLINTHSQKVLDGTIEDDSFFAIIYGLDDEDRNNWDDENLWIKANPNLGVSVKLDDLKIKAKRAKEMPSQLNAFLRLHLNIWTESVTRWIMDAKWMLCDAPVDDIQLRGRECYGGLDLSSNTDTTSLVLVFPPTSDDPLYRVLPRFFIPEDNLWERVRRDKVPYDIWVRQGLITATSGNVIDYSFILAQIASDAETYDLRELAFDRWGATKVVQDLQEMGFEDEKIEYAQRHLVQFGQGFVSMSTPSKELETMILSKEIAHGGNPVLRWMISNTVVRTDPAGNIKPDKEKSTERIDGVVALIMALGRAVKNAGISTDVGISFI